MRIASVVTALGVAAAAFALPAAAQNKGGWYIGYNAGQSKYNFSCTGNCSDTGAGFSLFGGVGLHPNVALEFGYADLGKSTFGASNIRANVWELSGLGQWRFGTRRQFGVFGRLGLYSGELKATTPSTSAEIKHGTTDLTYGIGAVYDLSSKWATRAEWQRFANMGGGGFNVKADVDLLSLGILYKF